MIRTGPDGRRRSERTAEEDQRAVVDALALLPAESRKLFESLLGETDPIKAQRLSEELENGLYHTKPVSMEQFLDDPYYLGDSMVTLRPGVRESLIALFEAPHREVVLAGSIGWGKCVHPSTEIYLPSSGRRITVGEAVGLPRFTVASMGDGGSMEARGARAFPSGRKRCVRLVLFGGQAVILSTDHPVYTDRGWVEAGRLTMDDLVATPRRVPEPAQGPDVSDDVVRFVALLMADGGCTGPTTFTNQTPVLLSEFADLVMRLGDSSRYDKGHRWIKPGTKRVKDDRGSAATTLRASAVRWLVTQYGCEKKAIHKRLPAEWYGLPLNQVALFLNRFWACDGSLSVGKPQKAEVTLASEGLIDDLRFLLLRLGVHARKYPKKKSYRLPTGERRSFPAWCLTVTGAPEILAFLDAVGPIPGKEQACADLRRVCAAIKSNPNSDVVPVGFEELRTIRSELLVDGKRPVRSMHCPRGQRISRAAFERMCAATGYSGHYAWLATSDLLWERIRGIEDAGDQDVFDLTVPETHNFVGNGVVLHNTFFSATSMCRIVYELSCLRDPQSTFGLGPGTEMVLMLMSRSLVLCREVLKTAVDDKIKASPYFMSKFPPKISTDYTLFPNNIRMTISSYGAERALGTAIFSAICDETNFPPKRNAQQIQQTFGKRMTAAHFDIVEKVYRALVRRIRSRFLGVGGDFPGMVILSSSAATLDSFTERKMREDKDDPDTFVVEHTQWSTMPEGHFCGEVFYVLCSKSSLRSRILDAEEAEEITNEYLDEHDAWMVEVPVEFRDDFEGNLEDSLRDIAGVSTQAISAFFQRVDAIDECVVHSRPHPFSTEHWVAGGPGSFQWDKMCRKIERRLPGGFIEDAWVPRENPQMPRWIHIDTSTSGDSTGFCMGYIDRWVEVVRRDGDGNRYTDTAPYYVVEVMLCIRPPAGEQIYMPDVRRLVYELQAHGYPIAGFSTDTYQYVEMHQQVRRHGIHTELISMDTTVQPYEELKSAIYERRLDLYDYPVLLSELRALEYDRVKGKIDHPKHNTKDVSDALAGVVWGLRQRAARLPWAADADTPKVKVGHEHQWVSPLIPAEDVDFEEVRAAQRSMQNSDLLPPILMGDDD